MVNTMRTFKQMAVFGCFCMLASSFLMLLHAPLANADTTQVKKGKCYVIGAGPAGPEHATGMAIEIMQKADAVFCSDDMRERFSDVLKEKTFLGDPWRGNFKYNWKDVQKLGPEEKKAYQEERIRFWDQTAAKIRDEINQGRIVAVIDSGDPCVFAPAHRVIEGLNEDEFEIVPGVGCFQASMAALKKSSIPAYDTRFVMLTAPMFLFGRSEDEAILKDLSRYPVTMAFYMALGYVDTMFDKLKKYYPNDLPVAVVYNAGFPDKEKVLKGTLDTIVPKIKAENEQWLGMVIIGRCLEGQPQRGMVKLMAQ